GVVELLPGDVLHVEPCRGGHDLREAHRSHRARRVNVEVTLQLDQPESQLRVDPLGGGDIDDVAGELGADVVAAGEVDDLLRPLQLGAHQLQLTARGVQREGEGAIGGDI